MIKTAIILLIILILLFIYACMKISSGISKLEETKRLEKLIIKYLDEELKKEEDEKNV